MKKVILAFTIFLSLALFSSANSSSEINKDNEELGQCLIVDIPGPDGKCYQYCPPLWQAEEIPCR